MAPYTVPNRLENDAYVRVEEEYKPQYLLVDLSNCQYSAKGYTVSG